MSEWLGMPFPFFLPSLQTHCNLMSTVRELVPYVYLYIDRGKLKLACLLRFNFRYFYFREKEKGEKKELMLVWVNGYSSTVLRGSFSPLPGDFGDS